MTQTPSTNPQPTGPGPDWTHELVEQIDWHWRQQLRPRLEGLTDAEYFWEPAPGSWAVRRRGEPGPVPAEAGGLQGGSGDWVIDFAWPEPVPAPITTIAWRLGHLIVGVLAVRTASHFGGEADYMSWPYAGTAAEAVAQLDEQYDAWIGHLRALDAAALARPCGAAEGPYADEPFATLILHINRELIHHGAEIALLRDLFAHR